MSIHDAFNVTRTGLKSTEDTLHIKSMNIASQGADAYKRKMILITDLSYVDKGKLSTPTSGNGTYNPTGIQMGLGVQTAGVYSDYSQGDPISTSNPLDVMIQGEGFFMVNLPDGSTAYTRVGALQVNNNYEIVMPKTGYVVQPGIVLPSTTSSIKINEQGQVYVTLGSSTNEQLIGQFQIATFYNPNGLRQIGDSMLLETTASGTPDTGVPGTNRRGLLQQGWREGSNVSAVEEMTDLIQIEKIYDMLTKVLKTGDSMMTSLSQAG